MEKAARQRVVVKRGVDRVGGHHRGQRQIAAGQALGQTQKIGSDAGLLVREEGAGATEADHDLVADQMDAVAVARFAGQAQIMRIVHDHPAGPLHQRFDDERGQGFMVCGQIGVQRRRRARRHVGASLARPGGAEIRRGHGVGLAQQRRVGVLVESDVGHPQGP